MHTHVDEHSAGPSSVLNEESRRIVLVTSLTADNRWAADKTLLNLVVNITVGVIETTRETTHDLQVRLLAGSIHNLSALYKSEVSMIASNPKLSN